VIGIEKNSVSGRISQDSESGSESRKHTIVEHIAPQEYCIGEGAEDDITTQDAIDSDDTAADIAKKLALFEQAEAKILLEEAQCLDATWWHEPTERHVLTQDERNDTVQNENTVESDESDENDDTAQELTATAWTPLPFCNADDLAAYSATSRHHMAHFRALCITGGGQRRGDHSVQYAEACRIALLQVVGLP